MNEPCNNCSRGLVVGTNEVCDVCGGTGFRSETPIIVTMTQIEANETDDVPKKSAKKTTKGRLK